MSLFRSRYLIWSHAWVATTSLITLSMFQGRCDRVSHDPLHCQRMMPNHANIHEILAAGLCCSEYSLIVPHTSVSSDQLLNLLICIRPPQAPTNNPIL